MNSKNQKQQISQSLKAITEIFGSCNASYRVLGSTLSPTEYNFENVKFVGIPISSVIAGIRQSFLNPKRKLDKQILGEEINKNGVKTYNNISVYVFGVKLPYLYDLFSFFYNIYGGIRVMFGRKYEIWD